MTKSDEQMLDTFLHKCLRRILRIYWPRKLQNETVREKTGIGGNKYDHQKEKVAMDRTRSAHGKEQACQNCINVDTRGKRLKRGRPKETWRRTGERES